MPFRVDQGYELRKLGGFTVDGPGSGTGLQVHGELAVEDVVVRDFVLGVMVRGGTLSGQGSLRSTANQFGLQLFDGGRILVSDIEATENTVHGAYIWGGLLSTGALDVSDNGDVGAAVVADGSLVVGTIDARGNDVVVSDRGSLVINDGEFGAGGTVRIDDVGFAQLGSGHFTDTALGVRLIDHATAVLDTVGFEATVTVRVEVAGDAISIGYNP